MSPRATFLLLLFVNLAFLGWATLIDVPPEPPQSNSISNLPQLKLLSEVRGKRPSTEPAPAPRSNAAAPTPRQGADNDATSAPAANGSAGAAGAAPAGAAPAEGAPAAAVPAVARNAPAAAQEASAEASGAGRRCITIGPFADPERAREASDVLRQRGFMPRARTASSRAAHEYWVFVGGLRTPADEASVLHRLERNGISDAKVMPASDGGRRVSVGLFSALDGAERRARAVRRLGLDAQVEPRSAEPTHWLDVDLGSSGQSLPAEGLLALEEPGSRLEIKECPAPEQGAGPAPRPLTAARRSRPG